MYSFIQKILFHLPPEKAHFLALNGLKWAHRFGLLPCFSFAKVNCNLMGLSFPNQVGIAAGLDKNGDYIETLAQLGFGFIEIGTVTPKPQIGNPKPRLFRSKQDKAIINRMGFNSKGMDYVLTRLNRTQYHGILGINIGKNKETPIDAALNDYLLLFKQFAPFASYITINISSPNTADLRNLQQKHLLNPLLSTLKNEQKNFYDQYQKYVPLVVKISPDLNKTELSELVSLLIAHKIDGVIATNTTLSRIGVTKADFAKEQGGLSGAPLNEKSTTLIQTLAALLPPSIPIIASGGVMDKKSIQEKLTAGAKLAQVYSGLIFNFSLF